jgi:hypothetical protein
MSLDKIVSIGGVKTTLRDRYLRGIDFTRPEVLFASSFCVDLSIVTSDGFMCIGKRGSNVLNYKGLYSVPVMETVHPQQDVRADGTIDVFSAALRGAQEEAGIEVGIEDIEFYSLHVDPVLYIHGLTGAIMADGLSRSDLISRRSVGVKDKWESSELVFVHFKPRDVAEALRELGGISQITPSSFVCIVQTLVSEFGYKSVENAFKDVF